MKFILNMQQLHELFHLTILEMLPKDSLSFPLNYVFAVYRVYPLESLQRVTIKKNERKVFSHS